MKKSHTLLALVLGASILGPQVEAREPRADGGKSKITPSNRTADSTKRTPAPGSKIERPAVKPTPSPVTRPAVPKPAARPEVKPSVPTTRPSVERPATPKPAARPEVKPSVPSTRPSIRPAEMPGVSRPDSKPGTIPRPDTRPGNLPGNKPDLNRPDVNKPSTLPGMGNIPNRPGNVKPGQPTLPGLSRPDKDRPNLTDRNPSDSNNRLRIDNSRNNSVHIDKVNVGGRNTGLNRPSTLPAGRRDWDDKKWGGNNSVWGNNVNIGNSVNVNIDNNFRRSNNFAYRPNYWGARPWWGAGQCHSWHHGHWGYGYSNRYYSSHWYFHDDNDFASGFMWGIAVWSLGNMIYDMGYNSYRNPYPAPAVQNTTINYSQPVSVTAAANPPGDEQAAQLAETKSAAALERSRGAFKQGDYVTAMSAVDEAIGFSPGDVTLHEYRALVLFALGKYADAAGVLNPVLASGPGWGWDTMVGFYNAPSTYEDQLRKLETYVQGKPEGAEGHFLLGYHYMVANQTAKSYEQFEKTAALQPADSIARQLRDLTRSSLPDEGGADPAPSAKPAPIPAGQLVATWVCDRGQDGKITFVMTEAGDYTWTYTNGETPTELKGTYGLNDKGLLVLTTDGSQMVSELTLNGDKLKFVLIGAPDGDPGLEFAKR